MQTKLEKRLSRLNDPTEPQNLKDRCFKTIPVASAAQNIGLPKTARPFLLQRVGVAAALLFVVAAGVAFWTTRPSSDSNKTTVAFSSIAFAQTVEAMRNVSFFHCKFRQLKPSGWDSSTWSYGEGWFDTQRGAFWTTSARQHPQEGVTANGNSSLDRELFLPDGAVYERSANSRSLLMKSDPVGWKRLHKTTTAILTGNVTALMSDTPPLNTGQTPRLVSTMIGNWKGQRVQVFTFQAGFGPRPSSKKRSAHAIKTKLYVNPSTHLIIGMQTLGTFADAPDRLVLEVDADYSKPEPAYFSPDRLKEGAVPINTRVLPKRYNMAH